MAIYNFIRGKKTGIINNYKAPEVQFVSLLRLPGVKQNQTKRFSMSLTLKKNNGENREFPQVFFTIYQPESGTVGWWLLWA